MVAESPIPSAYIASKLAQLSNAFEISDLHSGTQILFVKGLGLKTLLIDTAGEQLIRFSQLESLRLQAGGNSVEFERLLRIASGQAWFDHLEPLRRGLSGVDGLRRVS